MADLILRAEPRTVVGKKVKQLRRAGLVPGVVYGPGLGDNTTIQVSVDQREFVKFYLAHGFSTLFGLNWESKSEQVFIRDVQIEPVKRTPVHVDFFAPNLRKVLIASVPVVLRHADARHEGVLTQLRTEIEISALPRDFPHEIALDASHLSAVGDSLKVGDLTLPKGVTAVTDADELIALISPEAAQEAAAAAEEAPEEAAAGAAEAGAEETSE